MHQHHSPEAERNDVDTNPSLISSPILTTKLYRPFVPAHFEARADLVTRLESNRHRALTLISAPTGYGKSTLASMWLDACDVPSGWISLDENDDDLYAFLAYVASAIQSVFPDISLQTQALVNASTLPLARDVARIVLNDFEQLPQRMLLVLDDLHVIRTQAVYDLLAELLRYPSPRMHLVLITRRDPPLPIASLRAYGQLTEIRAQDLRFSTAQTAGLLARILQCEVDETTAAAWTERSEGWVMALNLAAISLRQLDQQGVSPDDVPVDTRYLQEHLLVEVLDNADPTLMAWLRAIALLDRFCVPLCAAVFQPNVAAAEAGPASEKFLQWLRRENLFVISLDSQHHWFRLHHLFRQQVQKWGRNHHQDDDIVAIHQRAGAWFAHEGLIEEAIQHFVLAGDFVSAEELLLENRYQLMNDEQWYRLEQWFSYLPDQVVERSASLLSTVAILALHRSYHDRIQSTVQKADQLLSDLTPHSSAYSSVLGELSIIKGYLAIGSESAEAAVASAQRALQLLPTNALALRALALGELAIGMQMSGQIAGGYQILCEALKQGQWTRTVQVRLMDYLCITSFMQSDLRAAIEWAGKVKRISEELQMSDSLSHARYFQGVSHYLRGESDAAEPYLSALITDQATSSSAYLIMSGFVLSLIRNERGDIGGADAVIAGLATYLRQTGTPFALEAIDAFSVELALRRGDLAAARRKQVGVDFDARSPLWLPYVPQLTPLKLLLMEGTAEALGVARAALEEFEAQMRTVHRNVVRVEALALLSLVCDAQGDTASAATSLTTAVDLAQEPKLIRPFVDLGPPMGEILQRLRDRNDELSEAIETFVAQILDALSTSALAPAERQTLSDQGAASNQTVLMLPDPLTDREVQVLRLLATDRTPAEIATQNIVSVSTVRSQIKSVYRKLDVHSRIEAINLGRELNIL